MSAFDFGDAVWVKDGSECSVCCFRHMPGCIVDCQNLHPEGKGHYIRPPAPPAFPRPVSSPAIGKIPPAPPADKTTETTPETWMPEARQIAAQCWCDDETKNTEMDVVLAEAIAKRIAAWMDADAQAQRNCDYYRSLVIRCGNALGDAAKTCDDGSKSEDVLCAKVPELIEALVANATLERFARSDEKGKLLKIDEQPADEPTDRPAAPSAVALYGINLRDWFAGLAMQGFIANEGRADISIWTANMAYKYADAMMEARKNGGA